jgi:hypothetical protein
MAVDGSQDQGAAVGAGTRLRCLQCGREAIVTKGGDAALRCCGAALEVIFRRGAD